jgi:hypothetical protein
MVGRYPFGGHNTYTMLDNIKLREPDLSKFNEPLREILSLMLKKNPDERLCMNELAQLSYFQGINFS